MLRLTSTLRSGALAALAVAPLAALAQINAFPYVPSPSVIVDEMLKLGAVRAGDYLFDLGSGTAASRSRRRSASARADTGSTSIPSW